MKPLFLVLITAFWIWRAIRAKRAYDDYVYRYRAATPAIDRLLNRLLLYAVMLVFSWWAIITH